MVCDWLKKWIEFTHNGTTVRLQGMLQTHTPELEEVSVEQILKWDKGNDLWAGVLIEPATKSSTFFFQEMCHARVALR
jgi:hypothetical protein